MRILRALKPLRRPPAPCAPALAVALFLMGASALPPSSEANPAGVPTVRDPHNNLHSYVVHRETDADGVLTHTVAQPTAVELRSYSAKRVGAQTVALRWRTSFEARLVGFDLFRRRGARVVRLTKRSVPARNASGGASYTFVDRSARPGLAQYRLEAVELDGKRVWAGTVSVR